MCKYCLMKELKKQIKEEGNKMIFEKIDDGYEVLVLPGRGKKQKKEDGWHIPSSIGVFPTLPDICTCPPEENND